MSMVVLHFRAFEGFKRVRFAGKDLEKNHLYPIRGAR